MNTVESYARKTEEESKAAFADEEFAYAARQYRREMERIEPLSAEEEHELAVLKLRGDEKARLRLIEANLDLVTSFVRKYQGLGVPFLDLVQEGNIGLMNAVDHFDPDRGTRLSTMAVYWIKQSVLQALSKQSRMIQVPNHVSEELNRLIKEQRRLMVQEGREPSEAELSESLGVKPERIREMMFLLQEPLRLETPVGEENDQTLGDTVADPAGSDPEKELDQELLRLQIEKALDRLSEREREILIRHFGLKGGRTHTLDEMGREMKLSRERIRQIEAGAFKKLRIPLKGWKIRN